MKEDLVLEFRVDLGPVGMLCFRIVALLDHSKPPVVDRIQRTTAVNRMRANINSPVTLTGDCFGLMIVSHGSKMKKEKTGLISIFSF